MAIILKHAILFLISLLLYRFAKSKKPGVLVPFVPLTFIVAYQAHLAYGNKIKRIRGKLLHYISCVICSSFVVSCV